MMNMLIGLTACRSVSVPGTLNHIGSRFRHVERVCFIRVRIRLPKSVCRTGTGFYEYRQAKNRICYFNGL